MSCDNPYNVDLPHMKIVVTLLLVSLGLAFVVPTPASGTVCVRGNGVATYQAHLHVGAVEEIDLETDVEVEIEITELPQSVVYITDEVRSVCSPEPHTSSRVPLYIQVRTLLI